jgi:hypothetical protein
MSNLAKTKNVSSEWVFRQVHFRQGFKDARSGLPPREFLEKNNEFLYRWGRQFYCYCKGLGMDRINLTGVGMQGNFAQSVREKAIM